MGMDRVIEKKKWPPKTIIKYAVVASFVFLVAYMFLFRASGSSLNVKTERLTISTVEEGVFQEFIPIIGNVLPETIIFLDAVEGGRVDKIFLEAGTKVKKGDKILKLSNTNLLMTLLNNEAQVNRASNDLRSTRLQLEQNRLELEKQRAEADYYLKRIKRRYERNKALYEEDFISRQEFEEFKDEYEYLKEKQVLTIESQEKELKFRSNQVLQLETSLKQMQQSLDLLRDQLDNLTIKAPVSGHLTSLEAEVGQSKSQGQRLGQIDVSDGFKVRAEIDEHYIDRIQLEKVGHFDFSGTTYELKVNKIYPEVADGKFKVDLVFTQQEPRGIKRGQTLHIRLQLSDETQALLLPRGGFYQETGGNWVFLVDPSGDVAVKKDIRLGRQNPRYFEVLGGLQTGDRVITSTYENFGEMDRLVLKGGTE